MNYNRIIGGQRFYPYTPKGGEEVWLPSVTTILDFAYPKSKFLIDWQIEKGKEESERIKNEAADSGTLVHDACEQLIKGYKLESSRFGDKEAKRQGLI